MKPVFFKYFSYSLKAGIFASALVLVTNRNHAQVCSSPGSTIYSLSNSGVISPITAGTGVVGTTINVSYSSSTSNANGIGYNPVNGLFYYFQNSSNGASQQFVSYDPLSNSYANLAAAPITSGVNRGCVNFNGTGYYCLDGNANLCYYNIPTNTWTLICSSFTDQYSNNVSSVFNSQGSGDMAIDGLGNLWIVTSTSTSWGLYKIGTPLPTSAVASMSIQQLIDPSTSTPTGVNFVGIAFDPTGSIYMGTNNDLYILHSDYTLSHLSTFSTPGICGDLTSCNFPFALLAMNFKELNVSVQNNSYILISWATNEQMTSKGFDVERSMDGKEWSKIGYVSANDNIAVTGNYHFIDDNPEAGRNYYRIVNSGIDDKQTYSEIKIAIIDNKTKLLYYLWPNPAKDAIKIQNNNESYSIARIYSQLGLLVGEYEIKPGVSTISIKTLSTGAYIIHVQGVHGEISNQKFIKE